MSGRPSAAATAGLPATVRIEAPRPDEAAALQALAWPHRAHSRFVQAGGLRWHLQVWPAAEPLARPVAGPWAEPASGPASAPPAAGGAAGGAAGAAPRAGTPLGNQDSPPQGLLLLHGAGAATHSWRGLVPLLAGHGPLWAVDLPGHGFSGPLPAQRRSMHGMAACLAELLAALGTEPAAVLGHSAGAALALRMALDGQLPPGCGILGLNAALLPFEGLAGLLYAPMARLMAINPLVPHLAAWRARDRASVRRLIASTGSRIDDEGVALYTGLLARRSHVEGVLTMMAGWALQTLAPDLPRLRQPLHLLAGEADRTVPPQQARLAASRVPGAHWALLPGLGHLAHEEAPQQVAAQVLPVLQAWGAWGGCDAAAPAAGDQPPPAARTTADT